MSFKDNGYSKFIKGETLQHAELVEWLTHVGIFFVHPCGEAKRSKYENYLWTTMGGKSGIPDFLFFDKVGKFSGLALELKDKGIEVYTKKNVPKAAYKKQWEMLKEFEKRGWKTTFASGRDEAIKMIRTYYKM